MIVLLENSKETTNSRFRPVAQYNSKIYYYYQKKLLSIVFFTKKQEKLNVKATLLSWSDHKTKADEPEDEANRGQFDSSISWEELKKNQKRGSCGAQLGPNELLGDAINYSFSAVSTCSQ